MTLFVRADRDMAIDHRTPAGSINPPAGIEPAHAFRKPLFCPLSYGDSAAAQRRQLGSSGDASAVFVNSAALADLRNNLICYSNPDNLGVALSVRDASHATLVSNTNWLCATDRRGRTLALNSERMTLRGWQVSSGQDAASLASPPASFDANFRVRSLNLGAGIGQPLGLERDYLGEAVPTRAADIGAYQSPF